MNRIEPLEALNATSTQWFWGAENLLLHTELLWAVPGILQNKQWILPAALTGTDAPKHTINVYPLENEPGLGEFCTSPFTHSYMHIAKMLVSGQRTWGQLLAIFTLPCTVNKNCNCSTVQGLYPSQQSPWGFFWCFGSFLLFIFLKWNNDPNV